MSPVSRRNFVGALSTAPMVPAAAMAQTSVRISSTHSARYTSEGVFYDLLEPDKPGSKPSIVMIHGGGHTGSCFFATPDGRPGWAPYFAARGYRVMVPDWPGVGRSGAGPILFMRSGNSIGGGHALFLTQRACHRPKP